MTRERGKVAALVTEHYPAIARDLLGPLLDFLSLAREACGGDADKVLILLVIAIRTSEHEDFARYTQEQLTSGEVPVFPTLGTNVRSIADSVRAPKETIRRKVVELLETGWIDREDTELRFTALGYRELAKVRGAIERMAVRNFEVVEDLLKRSGD